MWASMLAIAMAIRSAIIYEACDSCVPKFPTAFWSFLATVGLLLDCTSGAKNWKTTMSTAANSFGRHARSDDVLPLNLCRSSLRVHLIPTRWGLR